MIELKEKMDIINMMISARKLPLLFSYLISPKYHPSKDISIPRGHLAGIGHLALLTNTKIAAVEKSEE